MTRASLDQDIMDRISLVRYPMIYLIVVAHTPGMIAYIDDPNALSFIGSFVNDGLIRLAIPMLSCISGFLIFHKRLDQDFSLLMRKRGVSLLFPILIWNIPVVLMLYVVQSQGLISYDFADRKTMYPIDLMVWINGVLSITDYPINYPLHFLRDLFVICLLVPWMGILLRKAPFTGLLALLVIFIPNLDGLLIRNDTIIITAYIGGMAAVMNWDLRYLDRYFVPLICVLVMMCTLIVVVDAGRPIWLPLFAPFIVWPGSSVLVGTPLGRWLKKLSRASVFLFLLHGLVLLALTAVFSRLAENANEFYVWLLIPVLVAVASQSIYLFLNSLSPGLLTVLLGGRRSIAPVVARTRA